MITILNVLTEFTVGDVVDIATFPVGIYGGALLGRSLHSDEYGNPLDHSNRIGAAVGGLASIIGGPYIGRAVDKALQTPEEKERENK